MNEEIIIEKILKSRIAGNCVLILSNGENIMAPIDSVMKLNLNRASSIDIEQIELLRNARKLIKLKGYAMRLCEGFSRSEKQIREKLKQKGYELEQIDNILAWLREMRLVNDLKFCDNFVRYAIAKRWGRNKTQNELRLRGVTGYDAEQIIDEYYEITDVHQAALIIAKKKMKLIERKSTDKQKDAIIRHLAGKGYDYDMIKGIIKEIFC
jgi:regulatory protein